MIVPEKHDASSFEHWLNTALPGEVVEYHRGAILPRAKTGEKAGTGAIAWAAYSCGLVVLVQRKHGPSDFSYLAKRRPRARP